MLDGLVSTIIPVYNRPALVVDAIRSVLAQSYRPIEIIVVDDGSTDGSCEAISDSRIRVIRHDERIGVAYSRDVGSRAARGDVLSYLDGHQRVGKNCLDRCAQLAIDRGAITCPDIRNYGLIGWRLHGARFCLCPERGYFSAEWRQRIALRRVSTVTGLRAPPYLIPRSLYPDIAWSRTLRGWGASEASIVVKSFFLGIPILHLTGPLARHRFQKEFVYPTTWDGIWRNHAIIARVCFDDDTWFEHWLPRVFEPHLTQEARAALESPEIQAEHRDFLARKVKTDRQFWSDLVGGPAPVGV